MDDLLYQQYDGQCLHIVKTEGKPTPEMSCISNIPQTMDNDQQNYHLNSSHNCYLSQFKHYQTQNCT